MSNDFIKTTDGTEIFYKDWGPKSAQPVVFHPRLAAEQRRLGHADAVLPPERLSRRRCRGHR
jgi:hypothetical protein